MPRTARAPNSTTFTKRRESRQSTRQASVASSACASSPIPSALCEAIPTEAVDNVYDAPRSPVPVSKPKRTRLKQKSIKEEPENVLNLPEVNQISTTLIKPIPETLPPDADVSGFQAVEAVNELYRRLKVCQDEIQTLRQSKHQISAQLLKANSRLEILEIEHQSERDRQAKRKVAWETENMKDLHEKTEQLDTTMKALTTFASAAGNLLPLLDVLSNDISAENTSAAENLQEVLIAYEKTRTSSDTKDSR